MVYQDTITDESVKEFEKQIEENRAKSVSRGIEPKAFMIFGMVVVGFFWLTYTKKMDIRMGTIIIAISFVIFYWMMQQTKGMGELDEQVFTNIIKKKLEFKQRIGELPKGILEMDAKGARPFRGGMPWTREKGFKITKHNGVIKFFVVAGDPFIANIFNIKEIRQGYDPSQKRDVEYITSEALESEKRREKELYSIRKRFREHL